MDTQTQINTSLIKKAPPTPETAEQLKDKVHLTGTMIPIIMGKKFIKSDGTPTICHNIIINEHNKQHFAMSWDERYLLHDLHDPYTTPEKAREIKAKIRPYIDTNMNFHSEFTTIFRRLYYDDINDMYLGNISDGEKTSIRETYGSRKKKFVRVYTSPIVVFMRLAHALENSVKDETIKQIVTKLQYTKQDTPNQSTIIHMYNGVLQHILNQKKSALQVLHTNQHQNSLSLLEIKAAIENDGLDNVKDLPEDFTSYDDFHTKLEIAYLAKRQEVEALYDKLIENAKDLTTKEFNNSGIPKITCKRIPVEVDQTIKARTFEFNTFRLSFYDSITIGVIDAILPEITKLKQIHDLMFAWRYIVEKAKINTNEDGTKISVNSEEYEPKGPHTPYPHQWMMYRIHTTQNATADLSEMGTGKTYGVLMAIDKRMERGQIERKNGKVLVIAPNTVVPNWIRQINLHTPHLSCDVVEGNFIERLTKLGAASKGTDILVTNYETFTMKFKFNPTQDPVAMADLIKQLKTFDMVVLDECHKIKNLTAQRTHAIIRAFDDAKYKVIMSGTINANTLKDIFVPFYFLKKGELFSSSIRNPKSPKDYAMTTLYGVFTETYFQGKNIIDKTFIKELRAMMEEISVRFQKKDCMDLPDKVYETRSIDMHPKQRKLYNILEAEFLIDLQQMISSGQVISVTSTLAKIMKLAQAANGWIYDHNRIGIRFPKNPKLEEMKNCVESMDLNTSKVVIWSRFIEDIHLVTKTLKTIYGDKAVVAIHGGRKCYECGSDSIYRFRNVEEFNNLESDVKIAVVMSSVGSHGIDLTGADYEIFYSNSYIKTDRMQAEDRCHRSGMRDNLTIIDLVMKNSIDEDIVAALAQHKSISQALLERLGVKEGLKLVKGMFQKADAAEEKAMSKS